MARVSKADRLQKIHSESLREFNLSQSSVKDNRLECLSDRRFCYIAGAQWEGSLARQFKNKPKFEVNKTQGAVKRAKNEYRANRIGVRFIPKDGSKDDKLTDACNGLYRADEQDSTADEAYDNAFDEGSTGGIGAWRLRAVLEDEYSDNEYQRIRIEPIFDADSTVFFNRDAKRQDKSDAKHCWVLVPMTWDSYRDEYNDDPTSWPKDIFLSEFDWMIPNDTVYVAEYYRVESVNETRYVFRSAAGEEASYVKEDFEDDEELAARLLATGWTEIRRDKIKCKKIHKYLMSGGKILEDQGYIAGTNIPIVPFFADRQIIDNVERCQGIVRIAKDTQRIKNMQISKLAEISAKSAIEKPIFAPEQVTGFAQMWADDNIADNPYLLANPITDAGGTPVAYGATSYTKVPNIPPAMAALLQVTDQDIKDLLGADESVGQMNAAQSGVATEMVQNKVDMGNFYLMSNMAKAVKRSAEIWLGMMKDIAVEAGRKMKTMSEQGEAGQIELMRPLIDEVTGATVYENDLSNSSLEVYVEIAPSSSSRRNSVVRAAAQMMGMTQDPETQQVLGHIVLMNMEGEGIEDMRKWSRTKLLNMGVVTPTEEEQKILADQQAQAAQQPPDANTKFLQASANKANADAQGAQAKTQLTIAQVEKTAAETQKIIAETDLDNLDSFGKKLDNLDKAEMALSGGQSGQPKMTEQPEGKENESRETD
jgi:hypothetical protein